jgi:hypothetical protein
VFRSVPVPPYVRRGKAVEGALPWLFNGVSIGEMREVLVGPAAKGLSAPVVARLKQRCSRSIRRGGANRSARTAGYLSGLDGI